MSLLSKFIKKFILKNGVKLVKKRVIPIIVNEVKKRASKRRF